MAQLHCKVAKQENCPWVRPKRRSIACCSGAAAAPLGLRGPLRSGLHCAARVAAGYIASARIDSAAPRQDNSFQIGSI
eukprot:COSAG06_NODE_289_length_18231_cov_20.202515_25_plen_78_part_00